MTKVLLTTTSYQDTPGPHHAKLESFASQIVRQRGPLSEKQMLELAGDFDAFLCGDDQITRNVLEASLPRLKVISKYGIGVDKIDVDACSELGIPVTFCPGVNHTTVAEHVFLLMLMAVRQAVEHVNEVRNGNWKRMTGNELAGKHLGIVGLGRIGQEVAKRAAAFGMKISAYAANYWPIELAEKLSIQRCDSISQLLPQVDFLSLNTRLTPATKEMICQQTIELLPPHAIIINCGRGELIKTQDVVQALSSGRLGGYAADVLDQEPPPRDHPLLLAKNCIITPHIGSRTHESVQRQAMMATENLVLALSGESPLAQVNL